MKKKDLLGKGNTAEVFEYENGRVCKLFFEEYPCEYVNLDFQNAMEMYKSKLRIPKSFQIVTVENRKGIIYEKIEGKTLLNIMMNNNEILDELFSMFANLYRDIMLHHSKNVLSYKD